MLSNPYFKSVLWLIGFGGMGYGLMLLTEPNADKIERIKASGASSKALSADDQRKALFMKKLQEAATTSTPVYRTSVDKKES
ncbi:uncharacterized protein LOC128262630 [Drosophila gunungcola]|uniref:uncharacterized protein LOC128262630 n=1 Tax=Drosophila gunungcola TaxID=103775 RepID=UPI0022E4103E|nr:uncharacterized protein LOC128262630 [Drosophila gunungcola]